VVGAWLSGRFGVPLLTLLRGTDVPGHRELEPWMHRTAGPLIRLIWRRSSRVISNSEAMARQAERSLKGLSVETVHNGVDLTVYRPRQSANRSGEPLRVLYAGRLVRVKRLEELIRVWAGVVKQSQVPVMLELAGFGPEREGLERLVGELGLSDHVNFLGQLDEAAMIQAYQRASIFVSWSRDEGLPNAVLEAMACGLPVVLSDIGPHREIVADSDGGILCDADPPSDLLTSLLDLIHNPDERALMGRLGRGTIEARFSWQRTAHGLQALFPGTDRESD
jgi:glycosyltransferase involved in cell wall biosynthesis